MIRGFLKKDESLDLHSRHAMRAAGCRQAAVYETQPNLRSRGALIATQTFGALKETPRQNGVRYGPTAIPMSPSVLMSCLYENPLVSLGGFSPGVIVSCS
jgi:hypothetical protein